MWPMGLLLYVYMEKRHMNLQVTSWGNMAMYSLEIDFEKLW